MIYSQLYHFQRHSPDRKWLTGNGASGVPNSQGALTFLKILLPHLCSFACTLLLGRWLSKFLIPHSPPQHSQTTACQGSPLLLPLAIPGLLELTDWAERL